MKPKTDKLLSDVEKKFGIRCGKHHPRLKLSTYLKRKGYSSMSRLLEMTKPKTDKQGWEEEFDKLICGQIYSFPFNTTRTEGWVTVNEEPISIVGLAISNDEVKDFIRDLLSLQREQVRREVVEEIRDWVEQNRDERPDKLFNTDSKGGNYELGRRDENTVLISELIEVLDQLSLSSDGEKKGGEK